MSDLRFMRRGPQSIELPIQDNSLVIYNKLIQ